MTDDFRAALFVALLDRNLDAVRPGEALDERAALDLAAVYAREALDVINIQIGRWITGEVDRAEALAAVVEWAERRALDRKPSQNFSRP